MAVEFPLIVLDEVMLPGADTEVGLDPEEASQLAAAWGDAGGGAPVVVGCRAPGHAVPTRLEQRASGTPGQLMAACLVGEGHLSPPRDDDPAPRLTISRPTRQRLEDVRRTDAGWVARCSPWPLTLGELTAEDVAALTNRFLRVLLATRNSDPASDEPDGAMEQLEQPIADLVAAPSDAIRLLLLADYLFEEPGVRAAVLSAADASVVHDLAASALELAERDVGHSPGALRGPLATYLRAASEGPVAQLGRAASVLTALTPLVSEDAATLEAARQLAADLADVVARFERLAVKLAKRPGRAR